jgi:hypothetical protein
LIAGKMRAVVIMPATGVARRTAFRPELRICCFADLPAGIAAIFLRSRARPQPRAKRTVFW